MAITVQMREQVSQLYVALFGRAPDGEGLGYWVGQLDAGKTLVDVANTMYATAPARVLYPSFLTNQEIIGNFYTNVLGLIETGRDSQGRLFVGSVMVRIDKQAGNQWTVTLQAGAPLYTTGRRYGTTRTRSATVTAPAAALGTGPAKPAKGAKGAKAAPPAKGADAGQELSFNHPCNSGVLLCDLQGCSESGCCGGERRGGSWVTRWLKPKGAP